MRRVLINFVLDETGAVTLDWLLLTAAIVSFSVIGLAELRESAAEVESSTGAAIAAYGEELNGHAD
ncbi:hypothetical protein GCM10011415_34880 [Salipiger pallidus]|uniref:Flp pilus assembly protein, pilin Flp n=1 Tax=Salipiger pallidus TaxID=1775170 RepID=A0A8J2ZMX9_9RHOB|nr:hypothetical protein [Salipiger pallidus]GGG82237.1 hypothetical protein GCM10011415_34880 [Salipiger pallidus]